MDAGGISKKYQEWQTFMGTIKIVFIQLKTMCQVILKFISMAAKKQGKEAI